MAVGNQPEGLKLTEEEAFALLGLCLTSPTGLDAVSEESAQEVGGILFRQQLLSMETDQLPPDA